VASVIRQATLETGDNMTAPQIDFHEVFRIHPTAMALLTADFIILDVNAAFLEAVGLPLEELVGHNVFEKVPKMPPGPGGSPKWTALEEAMTSGKREGFELTRYDIEDPANPGVFGERYWSSAVQPLLDRDGQVEILELSAREVTPIIEKFRALMAGQE
jgi:PAS domain-containing protein